MKKIDLHEAEGLYAAVQTKDSDIWYALYQHADFRQCVADIYMNEMRDIIEEHASNRILQKADMLLDSAMMNAERWDVFNEYKYICDMRQLTEIKYRIAPFMKLDSHTGENTGYVIRSMYFDDYDNTCYYDNLNGADPRGKFRIRIYNGESVQKIQFERCNLMNFSDVLKKSFIRNFTTTDIGK